MRGLASRRRQPTPHVSTLLNRGLEGAEVGLRKEAARAPSCGSSSLRALPGEQGGLCRPHRSHRHSRKEPAEPRVW